MRGAGGCDLFGEGRGAPAGAATTSSAAYTMRSSCGVNTYISPVSAATSRNGAMKIPA
jgi:hypothetical protein